MNKKLLRKKLALMLANLKKKRKYYTELEYLESTGTQYIDTGLKGKNNIDFDYKCIFTNLDGTAQCVGGNWSGAGQSTVSLYLGLIRTNGNFAYHYDGTQSPVVVMNTTVQGAPYSVQGHMWVGEQYMVINGTKSSVGTISSTFTSTLNMYLFGINNNGLSNPAYMKLYYCKIYDNGTLVRDFIPVLDWDMTPCMYDKVTEQLFYNQGTGDFIAGREIHYVDYLESTGTQHINTGLLSTDSSTVDIAFSFTSMEGGVANNVGVFGGRNGMTSNTFTFFKIASATPQYFRFDYNGQVNVATANQMTWNTSSKYRFQYNGTNCITTNTTTGESVVTAGSPASTFTQHPIHLFAVNTSGTVDLFFIGRIYYYKYSDGTNSVDMVPAIDSDGVGYMFDRVSHTIFDNAGTGAFGYSAREVEYLTSNGGQYIDTGIQPTDDYGYRIRNTYTADGGEQCAIGCMDNGNRFVGVYTSGSSNAISGAWGSYVGFLPSYPWTTGTILDVKCNYKNSRQITIDDTEVKDISDTHITGTISNSIYIGARNYGSNVTKMKGDIYGAEITNGQNVVADFIPVYKDGVACMVDKLTGTAYLNQGTGSFSVGRIVEPEYE